VGGAAGLAVWAVAAAAKSRAAVAPANNDFPNMGFSFGLWGVWKTPSSEELFQA
jgi:hypothetical protein